MHKNECTTALLDGLLDAMSGAQAESLVRLRDSFAEDGASGDMDLDGRDDDGKPSVDDVGVGFKGEDLGQEGGDIQELSQRTGWSEPVAVWVPRPVGV